MFASKDGFCEQKETLLTIGEHLGKAVRAYSSEEVEQVASKAVQDDRQCSGNSCKNLTVCDSTQITACTQHADCTQSLHFCSRGTCVECERCNHCWDGACGRAGYRACHAISSR